MSEGSGCSTPAGWASRATGTAGRPGSCWTPSAWTATWRRVEYPIDEAARAIEDAGLPPVLAERLYSRAVSGARPTAATALALALAGCRLRRATTRASRSRAAAATALERQLDRCPERGSTTAARAPAGHAQRRSEAPTSSSQRIIDVHARRRGPGGPRGAPASSFDHLFELRAASECDELDADRDQQTTQTETTQTETTPTETTPTETTPTETDHHADHARQTPLPTDGDAKRRRTGAATDDGSGSGGAGAPGDGE